MTVNTGGILQIGNSTATQFGPAGVYSGNISTGTGGTLRLWSSSNQTLSGIISGSGGINKAYAGTLTISGANTYTGRTSLQPQTTAGFTANVSSFNSVVGGTASSSLGAPTTVANGTVDIGSGGAQATVNLTYTGASGETTDRVMNIVFNSNSSQTITANNASGVLRFTSAFTSSPTTGSGKLTIGGTGAGQIDQGIPQLSTGGLEKAGTGIWTLGGSGIFTGPTTITAGTLSLSSATALQNSPFNTASAAGTGSLGLRIDTTTLTLGGLTGANALRGRFTTALGGPLNATAQGGYDGLTNLSLNVVGGTNLSYTGVIAEGATGMSVTKTGAGIQTLNAAHGYTGTTFVNGGFLQLNGSNLTGGLSVSNGHFASNSTFAGVSTVGSGGVISPGASNAIGAITLTNATASALTLDGGTGIFDLPSTVTTPDGIAVTGGLVINGTNTFLLRTPTAGTPAGVYTLITAGSSSGAGSLVLANGSATRGNATISTSGNDVILTVGAGGLSGTTTYTGAATSSGTDGWNVGVNWNGGIPTGTINVVLPDKTLAFNIGATANTIPTFNGDLWIGNNVTLQMSFTSQHNATIDNVLGTPGQTIIYMGSNSAINNRNSYGGSPNKTIPQVVLLGDASMRFQESTNGAVTPNFDYSISGAYTLSFNSGFGGTGATHNLNAANSVAGLSLTTGASNIVNANASGSIGTANLAISGGGTVNLNHASAISDGTNPIRIDNGTITHGAASAATLTLTNRPIQLNGAGQATINNNNTASSSANILTLGGGVSSTAAGAKTLTLGGTNVGLNTISGNITNGSGGGSVVLSKTGVGTWVLSGNNTYTGLTTVSNNGTLILSGDNTAMTGGVTLSAGTSLVPKLHINSATALGTGTLNFGGGAATDTVQIDNSSAGAVTVSTANAITLNRNFTFVGTQSLNLGTGTTTIGGITAPGARVISVSANTLTFGGVITETLAGIGITKQGIGSLTLASANNSFSGSVTLTGGTTNITKLADSGSNSSLGTGSSSAPIRMNGGTLSYTGTGGDTTNRAIEMVAGAAINNNGSGTIDFTAANVAQTGTASARTLTLGGTYTGGANTLGSIIGNSGTGANITSLVKNGNSTWILSNGNTYTGTTTVNAGTLALGANDVLPDNSAITMASGTLNAATFSDAVGTLDVTAAAVINLGTGGAVAFADSSAVDWTGGILNITGTLGATSLRFGTSSSGLTPAQLAVITVNGSGAGTYTLDADGYLIGGGSDMTPPTLTSITDNVSGGPVDIGATINFTVTFNEDIDAASVTSADFNNNGTAGITVGAISETSAGVFTVAVTANSAGSLKLRIPTGAVIEDVALNDLVVPVEDDTTITVLTLFDTWANATYVPPLTMKLAGDDQDGDTFINLMEFAFGTQPTVSSAGSIVWVNGGAVTTPGQPVAINMANPGVDYRAVFGRRKDYAAAGLTYTVEFSAGLNVWVPSAVTPTVLTGAGGLNASEIEAVSVPYPLLIDVGGNNFKKPTFFRLTISN